MKRFMRWSLGVALVMGLSLAGMPSSQAAGDPKVLSMLVMGDSYSAGNGAGSYYGAAGCWRSAYNYAREYERIVEKAPYSQRGFVENVACSGDTTSAINNSTNGRPPQINAVNTGYDIVFLTLGGNDIYFGDIVYHCLIGRTRTGSHCNDNLTRAETLLRNGTLKQRLTTALRSIRNRTAMQTKIVLLGYPYLESDPGYWLANGNSKVMVGGRVRAIGDLGDSIQRQVVGELNAGTSGQPFVFVSVKGLFAGPPSHELSARSNNSNRWMVQPMLDASWASKATYYHPNPTGWSQEARLLANDGRVPKHPQPTSSSGGSGSSGSGSGSGSAPSGVTEQSGSYGSPTFTNPTNASGPGPRIPAMSSVQVSCRIYAPAIASANPDGWWYRITSSPWNNAFYAVANTFWNGDVPGVRPYTHNTDWSVPVC